MSAPRLAHAHNPLSFLEIGLITVVLGVAAAVAVPEYFHLRQDANDDSAKTRLVQAQRNLATGATLPVGVKIHTGGCLETTAGGHLWHADRQSKPTPGAC